MSKHAIRPCKQDDIPEMLEVINQAAQRYRGAVPAEFLHEPYMSLAELEREIAAGVGFLGLEREGRLVGVMGQQDVQDVRLIRHAYVRPLDQGSGAGAALIDTILALSDKTVLVGTWAAATWAIRFYEGKGFLLATPADGEALLRRYWTVSDRQIANSVVLTKRAA